MTEAQFQEARKVMQSANYRRGIITAAKGDVAKWTKIEDSYRQDLQPGKAEGAKKMLTKAMDRLKQAREKFAEIMLPPEDFKEGIKWIAALCHDSYNYLPKEIKAVDFEKAQAEDLELFPTKEAAQNECDRLNGQ